MEEIITILATQGLPVVLAAVFIVALVKGIPSFFKWVALQWEDIKKAFISYMSEQSQAMKELSSTNKEVVSTVLALNNKMDDVKDEVKEIKTEVKEIKQKVEA